MFRKSRKRRLRKGEMKFHLQLYPPQLSSWVIVLLVLFSPAVLTAYLLRNLIWLAVVPFGIIFIAFLIAAIPLKRKVTREQFADELERHLLGTEGKWDWDDTTSVAIADEGLEQIRCGLSRFASLRSEKDREELRALIATLRRGDLPEIVSPTHFTYGNR